MGNPLKRAHFVLQQIDAFNLELFKDKIVMKHLKCKKGCTACCYTQVSVTRDEADLLVDRIIERGYVDLEKLSIQARAENDTRKWYQMPYQMRSCAFLDENGECSVYNDRPAVCRTNMVISDPASCDTRDGREKPKRLLNTYKSDMALMAGFMNSKENGALPGMVLKALKRKLHQDRKAREKLTISQQQIPY